MKNTLLFYIAKINFLYPYNLGIRFVKYKRFFSRNWTEFDNCTLLLKMANYAIKNIPFYKRNNTNEYINSIEDFKQKVSLINKDIIMANWHDFVLPNYPRCKVREGTTGGTSGKPLRLLTPRNRYIVEQNTMNALWENIGWKGHIRGVIRNAHLGSTEIYQVNPLKKEIIFDGFRTDMSYYEKVYNVLKKLNIQYIHAYPSSAYQFSLFLKKTKKPVGFIKGFLCGSESLTSLQEKIIKDELGIPVYNWYGHSEKLILGGPCKGNDAIHIEPSYGFFELVDKKGNEIEKVGQIGEIVGTSLHNMYMPFMRYMTGDFAEYAGSYCPFCKRKVKLIRNIQGRRDINKIYLKEDTYVSITALNLHSDLYNFIEGMQYVQLKKGELKIYLIKGENYHSKIEDKLKEHFLKALLNKCDFEFIYTNKIENEPNGKFLPLKQFIQTEN